MQAVIDAIERVPVATITHVFVAVILGVDLIVQGSLSSDALTYAGIVEGGNIGVAGSRAHLKAAKLKQPKVTQHFAPGDHYFRDITFGGDTTDAIPVPVGDAPDEPGDDDALPHVSTTSEPIPADQGDAGEAGR